MTDKEFEPQTGNFDSSLSAIITSLTANQNSNPRNHTLEFEHRCRINNLLPSQQEKATQVGESMLVTLRQRSDWYGQMARCDILEGLSILAREYPPAQLVIADSLGEPETYVQQAARRYLSGNNLRNNDRAAIYPETLNHLLTRGTPEATDFALRLIESNPLSGFSDRIPEGTETALEQMLSSNDGTKAAIRAAIAVSHLYEKTQGKVSENLVQQSVVILVKHIEEIVQDISQQATFSALVARVEVENYIQAKQYIKSQEDRPTESANGNGKIKDLSPQTAIELLVLHEVPIALPEAELGIPESVALWRLGNNYIQCGQVKDLQTLTALLITRTREKLIQDLVADVERHKKWQESEQAEKDAKKAVLKRKQEEEEGRRVAVRQARQQMAQEQRSSAKNAPDLFPQLFGNLPDSIRPDNIDNPNYQSD